MGQHISQPSRILIVSENLANCELLERSLVDEKYRIGSICNRRVAWKTLPAEKPDLVLLDSSKSGSICDKYVRRMKADEETRHIPLLLLISLTEMRDIENAVTAGCDDFLTKPLNEQELRSRVRSLLLVKQLRDELSD